MAFCAFILPGKMFPIQMVVRAKLLARHKRPRGLERKILSFIGVEKFFSLRRSLRGIVKAKNFLTEGRSLPKNGLDDGCLITVVPGPKRHFLIQNFFSLVF